MTLYNVYATYIGWEKGNIYMEKLLVLQSYAMYGREVLYIHTFTYMHSIQ